MWSCRPALNARDVSSAGWDGPRWLVHLVRARSPTIHSGPGETARTSPSLARRMRGTSESPARTCPVRSDGSFGGRRVAQKTGTMSIGCFGGSAVWWTTSPGPRRTAAYCGGGRSSSFQGGGSDLVETTSCIGSTRDSPARPLRRLPPPGSLNGRGGTSSICADTRSVREYQGGMAKRLDLCINITTLPYARTPTSFRRI